MLLIRYLYTLVTGIELVVSAKLLGVTFSHNLKFDEHVKNILTICNQRSYLLKWAFPLKNSILFSVP